MFREVQVLLECKQESLLFTDLRIPLDTLDRHPLTVETMKQPTTLQEMRQLLTLHPTLEREEVMVMEVLAVLTPESTEMR